MTDFWFFPLESVNWDDRKCNYHLGQDIQEWTQ